MSTVKNPQDFTDDEIEESLRYAANKLGFVEGFREQQRTALKSFLPGHDLFVALPSAHGPRARFREKCRFPSRSAALHELSQRTALWTKLSQSCSLGCHASEITCCRPDEQIRGTRYRRRRSVSRFDGYHPISVKA